MTNRQLSAQETKRKLFKTAITLLQKKGCYEINVEEITGMAGVSKGTFYTYFKRKEDIVLEINRAPFAEIAAELEKWNTPVSLTSLPIIFTVLWNVLKLRAFMFAGNG